MIYKKVFESKTEEDTKKIACLFGNIAKKGDVFALYGTLGVGKSCFSRYFIQHLTNAKEVPSPTFTLVQVYDTDEFSIYHYDMYRLKNPMEAYELGIEEAFFDGVNLIEWPEKIEEVLPYNVWKITITVKNDIRLFEIEVCDENKKERLEKIKL